MLQIQEETASKLSGRSSEYIKRILIRGFLESRYLGCHELDRSSFVLVFDPSAARCPVVPRIPYNLARNGSFSTKRASNFTMSPDVSTLRCPLTSELFWCPLDTNREPIGIIGAGKFVDRWPWRRLYRPLKSLVRAQWFQYGSRRVRSQNFFSHRRTPSFITHSRRKALWTIIVRTFVRCRRVWCSAIFMTHAKFLIVNRTID